MRRLLFFAAMMLLSLRGFAGDEGRYIEVSGTAEVDIVPDEIHYIIEMKEYFEEEFDGKSKPEDFATKVPLDVIERQVRRVIADAGVPNEAVRTEEIGNTWRERGMDFLVSKRLDITLGDFETIERIRKGLDTRGINAMYIGELKNRNMAEWQEKGRIEAIEAARNKAEYMASAAGCGLGRVLRIVEGTAAGRTLPAAQANVMASGASSADTYRTIKKTYTVIVRYELADRP